ncbi:MAG: hypothetical protein HY900_25490 [Deltaproteobacteria bacterium]|nr:hypothetical protein [Deltaproteobacteria bacterium]
MLNCWKQIRGVAVAASVLGLALTAAAADTKGSQAAAPAGPQVSALAPARVAPVAVVVRDVKTGQVRPATAQEIKALASEVDRLLDRGASAEKPIRMANGSTAYQVNGNFGSWTAARRNADGKLETGCFDEAGPAKRFLGFEGDPVAPATVKAEEK